MTNVRHADLLEKIGTYIGYLTNGVFRSSDFFLEDSYIDAKGEMRPCFLLTRKGCDMVANKMTGEKGVLFTAAYVTRFEEMEKVIALPKVPVANMQLDRITKLLDILRIGEHLFTLETDRAIRVQIAETILGESSEGNISSSIPAPILSTPHADDYSGKWYTSRDIAMLSTVPNASTQGVTALAIKHGLRTPKYSKRVTCPNTSTGATHAVYNELGKDRLLILLLNKSKQKPNAHLRRTTR